MKVRIEDTWHYKFYKNTDSYHSIISEIKKAQLPITEVEVKENVVIVYVEIQTLDDLNRLVEAFGCHIVYGDTDDDNIIIIEKYDGYRE